MEVEEASLLALEPPINKAYSFVPSRKAQNIAGRFALREKFGSGFQYWGRSPWKSCNEMAFYCLKISQLFLLNMYQVGHKGAIYLDVLYIYL
jgi:hypothetical protein